MGEKQNKIDNTNIFEDFTSDVQLGEEIKKQEEKQEKTIFYHLKNLTGFLKIINLLLFLVVALFFIYSFFQNRETTQNYSFLSPVCNLILGDVASKANGCYGLNAFSRNIESELSTVQNSQFEKISPLFQHEYESDNFTNSKSVRFLISKSNDKVKPLTILSEFDRLKNKFEPIDKSKIVCKDIVVREDQTFEARCEAYSSDWDRDITGINNTKKSGTSISVASSFIDFLENTDGSKFQVLDKQKIFFSSNVSGNGIYTKKTDFEIRLKYIDPNNLSL